MQQVARTTDALPALDTVENNTSSLVLLPHQFESFISDHPDFASGCRVGFDLGSEGYGCGEDSALGELSVFIEYEVRRHYRPAEAIFGVASLPRRVGFCLGWLSALACDDHDLAVSGLDYLSSRISFHYDDEVRRGCNPLVTVPGIHKSPLGVW